MDCLMSKNLGRILYWTGTIEPHREGIAKEVFMLHNHFKGSYVIGTSPHGCFMYSKKQRYFGIPSRLLPTVRHWAPYFERGFSISHIIQGIDNYHYLKARGDNPIILTAIAIGEILSMSHYKRVSQVVVECDRDRKKLISYGFAPEKVAVIYPGTDLSIFNCSAPPPEGKFKILFASSPFSFDYMEPRGLRLLLEAANIKRDVDFIFLWRRRGDTFNVLQQWISELSLTNVKVINEDIEHMNKMFSYCHATVAPFTSEKNNKSCPNSLIESLATGRPVLVSDKVGIADIIKKEMNGIVFSADVHSLVDAISKIEKDYILFKKNARPSATKYFNVNSFLNSYERLYQEVSLPNGGTV